jgi:hypothetical protein
VNDRVVRFPKSTWERIRNRRGSNSVDCLVSSRYVKFVDIAESGTEDGLVLRTHAMVDRYEDGPDKRLCELVLPIAEMRQVIAKFDKWTD